ncbi:putative pentatricopeptide repeat-containing protein At3g08820 isoform X2 [Rhodamnia argentea]|uniref:Pentatricopeptide repeat-containing protein At3g08820 isoform X2 n=1 Tax=Rhodamnia argentea TaxID=178133 RepID=A0ABM3HDS0_9MYRT|nr:putative pentatricopeptide repeat-containing protein At3g08820 isoform X2 [Rhodamnia argentea]
MFSGIPKSPANLVPKSGRSSRAAAVTPLVHASDLSTLLQGRVPRLHLLQIHARVFRLDGQQDNLVAARLIGQYPSRIAFEVFKQLKSPNIFPFNAIIRVFAEEGLFPKAWSLFRALKQRQLSPSDFTFSFLLKACFRCASVRQVNQIHTHVLKAGFCEDPIVCNGLLSVYAKSVKDLVSACKLFDESPQRNLVSWTSLISGYAQSGQAEDALQLFVDVVQEDLRIGDEILVSVLSACSTIQVAHLERWVNILSKFVADVNLDDVKRDSINIVLIHLYGKLARIDKCREKFNEITNHGIGRLLPWNLMITASVQNGCPMEALHIFHQMLEDSNRKPNEVTMVSVLSASAQVGDLDLGKWLHNYLRSEGSKGILQSNKVLATALIDMYCKCGRLEEAKEVFDQMIWKDIVSFNAMIMGLAMNGEGEEALRLFSSIRDLGLHPNSSTFLAALCACSHSGHIEEGLGVVASMPFEPNNFVWGALLGGCLLHVRGELAQHVSKKLVEVDPENSAGYVMLANAFAADRQWDDVSVLRWFMREKGVKKQPGHSWIQIDGVMHEFLVGMPGHPQSGLVYETLGTLEKAMKVP